MSSCSGPRTGSPAPSPSTASCPSTRPGCRGSSRTGQPPPDSGSSWGPSDRPVTMRAYLVVDPYYWATTGTPVPLDELTVSAAGADYATRHQRQADDGQDGAGALEPLPAASQAPAAGDLRGSARSATD